MNSMLAALLFVRRRQLVEGTPFLCQAPPCRAFSELGEGGFGVTLAVRPLGEGLMPGAAPRTCLAPLRVQSATPSFPLSFTEFSGIPKVVAGQDALMPAARLMCSGRESRLSSISLQFRIVLPFFVCPVCHPCSRGGCLLIAH